MALRVDSDKLIQELKTLATFSSTPNPSVTRIVYSEEDRKARAYFKKLCADAGLLVREDAVGNIFARWQGIDPSLPAVGTGSHTDAIPNAGMYDGTVGVLGGLEAIRSLQRSGFKPRRSIEVLMFAAEEPTRFGIGCFGSRLLCGNLDSSAGSVLKDKGGKSLDDLRTAAGFSGGVETVKLPKNYYSAFIELHIEQGPLLDREKIPLGIVTAIAAPASLRLYIEGEGGHAGGVLMPGRRDALAAASEIILAVEKGALSTGSTDTVGTVGICEVLPGAINSIPNNVILGIDVRDIDGKRRDAVLKKIDDSCAEISKRRNVSVKKEILNADDPATCDLQLIEALSRSAKKASLHYKKMVSRAYHDSLFMSRIAPTTMLFIPCKNGYSHRPDEYASPEAISNGVLVLAHALAECAG
ncbi:MAG TPA: M20 family metallo-hydrolase [Bacteroidota bacterium]|nr:M20 family metallo-hydrolase [Bacteroidota bacterium]